MLCSEKIQIPLSLEMEPIYYCRKLDLENKNPNGRDGQRDWENSYLEYDFRWMCYFEYKVEKLMKAFKMNVYMVKTNDY